MLRLVTIITRGGSLIPGAINLDQVRYASASAYQLDDGGTRKTVVFRFAGDPEELTVLGTLDDFSLPIPNYPTN